MMKKQSDESLNVKPADPQPPNMPPKPQVRYVGFEGVEGGRRLTYSVKPVGFKAVEITVDISDAAVLGTSGLSIQDAAPMAYEKIVELTATTEGVVESAELCLTQTDIAKYISRHVTSQKLAHSRMDRTHPSDVAA